MERTTNRKKILLHACCGPCMIYPHYVIISNERLDMDVFYYNPNIHPSTEYIRRLETLTEFCEKNKIKLIIGSYDPVSYFRAVTGNENYRCMICYKVRLEETAKYAAQGGYDWFETTLAVSPYQDHDLIEKIGGEAGRKFGIMYKYNDYRDGFRNGQRDSKRLGMYRQKYCGCIYSENERYEKKVVKAEKTARDKCGLKE